MTEREIFDNALALSNPAERGEYLDEACAGDEQLRVHVEELLTLHGRVGGFLESPAVATIDHQSASMIGSQIGPYKLREQIGEGGMGVVYVAEQTQPVKRKVALKIIKPGMDTRQVIARFEAERQALAMMDHPNIARIIDAGATDSGQSYFVMELVYGIPITEYCDQRELTACERLEIFVRVCRAVQHAHQKGVIHRDLKPSNVLVASIDNEAVPKVIDFGVAKAAGPELTDQTVYTQFSQMIGTPLYMSPEQAELGVADVDTRSDVYALGVLLYELLTGATPFSSDTLKKASFDEMRRIIREDEPPKPSAMVSTLKADALSTISKHRGSDPRRLRESLAGELDWLVMKAMEKDRNRRYESASALATDIERHLRNEPVAAGPPSAAYRVKKYVQRNKGRLIAASLAAVVLFVGVTVAVGAMLKNQREIRNLETAVGEEIAAAKAAIDGGVFQLASEKFQRAEARLADNPLAPPDLLAEVRGWQQELSSFRRIVTMADDLQKTSTDRQFVTATAEMLEYYGVFRSDQWLADLSKRRLQPSQIERVKVSVYTLLVQTAFRYYLVPQDYGVSEQIAEERLLKYLAAASTIEPLTPAFYFVRGKSRLKSGDKVGAQADHDRYASLTPTLALDYYIPARVEHQNSDYGRAIQLYRLALDVDARHYPSMENLGVCLSREERYRESLLCFLMAAGRHPEAFIPQLNLTVAYLYYPFYGVEMGDAVANAERHFRRLLTMKDRIPLEYQDKLPELANQLVIVSTYLPTTEGAAKKTLSWVEEASQRFGHKEQLAAARGFCYYRMGEHARALEALRELPEASRQEELTGAMSQLFLAMAHWQVGQEDEAIGVYETGHFESDDTIEVQVYQALREEAKGLMQMDDKAE